MSARRRQALQGWIDRLDSCVRTLALSGDKEALDNLSQSWLELSPHMGEADWVRVLREEVPRLEASVRRGGRSGLTADSLYRSLTESADYRGDTLRERANEAVVTSIRVALAEGAFPEEEKPKRSGSRTPRAKDWHNYKEAQAAVQCLGIKTSTEYDKRYREDPALHSRPKNLYPEWVDWATFFGRGKS